MVRPYQSNAIGDILQWYKSGNDACCLCMPTGSGKTFVFAIVAKEYHKSNETKVLILTHREELMKQAFGAIGEKCWLIEASKRHVPDNYSYYIGMVETVHNRRRLMPEFGLIIIDECHIGNFKKIDVKTKHLLGVTATPLTNKPPLIERYKKLFVPTTISDLIKQEYLCNCRAYGFKQDETALAEKSWATVAGEYSEKDMLTFYTSAKMVTGVLEAYYKKACGKKTLVFNVNIEHCTQANKRFQEDGLPSRMLIGNVGSDERKECLLWFKNTKDAILHSVGVLTTGFDEPSIECIILNRATQSLILYLQMIGRGSRTFAGKEEFILIDLGRNVVRHNMYDYEHNWHRYFEFGNIKPKGAKVDQAPPVKSCKFCEALIPVSAKICPYCLTPVPVKVVEEKPFELVEYKKSVQAEVDCSEAYAMAKEKGHSALSVFYRIAAKILREKEALNKSDDWAKAEMSRQLIVWCSHFKKRNNVWLQSYAKGALEKVGNKRQNVLPVLIKEANDVAHMQELFDGLPLF